MSAEPRGSVFRLVFAEISTCRGATVCVTEIERTEEKGFGGIT